MLDVVDVGSVAILHYPILKRKNNRLFNNIKKGKHLKKVLTSQKREIIK